MSNFSTKKRNAVLGLASLVVVIALFSVYIGFGQEPPAQDSSAQETQGNSEAKALEAIERLGSEYREESDPMVEIENPRDVSLLQGQANHFKANIEGMGNVKKCICRWQFYLKHGDREDLYKTQDTDCVQNRCGFTSTVDSVGESLLKVDMILKDRKTQEEEVVASDESNFTVSPF